MTDLPPLPTDDVIVVRADRLASRSLSEGVVITPEIIARAVPLRLDAIINQQAPGAGLFRRQDSASANATIQGLSLRPIGPNGASRASVSIDGVPQNDPFGGWVFWGRHDGLFLERVDVLAGGAGVGGGSGALTGTVDIVEQRGVFTRARASLGNAGSANLAFASGRRVDDGQVAVFLGHDDSDGEISVGESQRGPVDTAIAHRFTNATVAADVTANATTSLSARLSLFGEEKTSGLIGGESSATGGDASLAVRFGSADIEARVLTWLQVRDFSNRLTTANATRTASTLTLDQFATPAQQLGGSLLIQQYNGPHQLLVEATTSEGQTEELFRNQGAGLTRSRVAGGRQDVVSLRFAREAQPRPERFWWAWTVRADAWANSEAVRIERDLATDAIVLNAPSTDRDGMAWHGGARIGHQASGLSVSLYRSSRLPTLNELHRPFRVGNDATDANGDLKPETLLGLDLGWRDAGLTGLLTWQAQATVWAARLEDPIINVTRGIGPGSFGRVGFLPAGGAYRVRENAGAIEALGLDLSGQVQLAGAGERLGLTWAVALSEAEVVDGGAATQLVGLRPAQAPRVAGSLSVAVPIGLDRNDAGLALLSMGVTLRHEGNRFEDDLNLRLLPGYTAIDARFTWRWTPEAEVFLSAENLADTPIQARRDGDGLIAITGQRGLRVGVLWRR